MPGHALSNIIKKIYSPTREQRVMLFYTSLMMIAVIVFGWMVTDAMVKWNLRRISHNLQDRLKATAITLNTSELRALVDENNQATVANHQTTQLRANLVQLIQTDSEIQNIDLLKYHQGRLTYLFSHAQNRTDSFTFGESYTLENPDIASSINQQRVHLEDTSKIASGLPVRGHAPVIDQATGETIAVISMDFNTKQFSMEVEKLRYFGLGATGLLALFGVGCVWLSKMRDDLKKSIDDRKELEDETRKLAKVAEVAGAPMLITDHDGRVQWVNSSFLEFTSLNQNQAIGYFPGQLLYGPRTDERSIERIDTALEQRASIREEFMAYRMNRPPAWVAVDIQPVEGVEDEITGHVAVFHDISFRKSQEEKLVRQAMFDPLTRLPNRANFLSTLEERFDQPQMREEDGFVVMFLDLDGFKQINDTLGHEAGDQTLVKFAERLKSCIRDHDHVARLAGDEFTMLINKIRHVDEATIVARRLLNMMKYPMEIDIGVHVHPTTSIGLVYRRKDHDSPEKLLNEADAAMYQAKHSGKNMCIVSYGEHTETIEPEIVSEPVFETDQEPVIVDEVNDYSTADSQNTDSVNDQEFSDIDREEASLSPQILKQNLNQPQRPDSPIS